jgi:antitoxin CptB
MTMQTTDLNDLDMRRKRARYRAHHRGTQEMDIILGGYADSRLSGFGAAELDRFERLMDEQDADLYKWIAGQGSAPADADGELIADIADFQRQRSPRS